MALTRFYDRQSGLDGPVSGALQIVHIPVAASGASFTHVVNLPAGMAFQITDGEFTAGGITLTPELTIGDTSNATKVVAATTLATNTGALTIKDGTIIAGDAISIVITATAGQTVTQGNLTLVGHVASPPNSVGGRPGYPGPYS